MKLLSCRELFSGSSDKAAHLHSTKQETEKLAISYRMHFPEQSTEVKNKQMKDLNEK